MGWTAIAWLGGGFLAGQVVERLVRSKRSSAEALPEATLSAHPDSNGIPTVSGSPSPSSDQQWQLAYHLAAEMAQLKAGFLARTSHELRSPLNSVISLHQLILSDLCDSPEEEREFVSQSYDAAQKLLKLIDQITDLSKLEQGNASLSVTQVDLNELLLEVEQVVQIQAQNRNIRLTIEHPDDPVFVQSDRQRLLQVLIHLLTAPISLMDGGYIHLTVQIEDDYVTIQVADQRPATAWSESTTLLDSPPTSAALNTAASETLSGLTIMLCQQLMARMDGELVLRQVPTDDAETIANADQTWTKIDCRMPLAV
ncbi:MAG: HAMP domain-containing sensor histidine kinase [Elainellaceae cyanobacterium]